MGIGQDLACNACVKSMNLFRFEVARQINPKSSAEEKTALFKKRFEESHPCEGRHFPARMVVSSKQLFGRQRYQPYDEAWNKKGTAIVKSGDNIRNDLLNACDYFTEGHYDTLLEATI